MANSDTNHVHYLSHVIKRNQLKPGDHIYTYRAYGLYQHHGIYIGKPGREVIHFSGKKKSTAQVHVATLDEFLGGYALRLAVYGEQAEESKGKRHGTSYTMASRPASEVIEATEDFVQNPEEWGKYHLFKNNCESFAMFCKTGDESVVSGQVEGWNQFISLIGDAIHSSTKPNYYIYCTLYDYCKTQN